MIKIRFIVFKINANVPQLHAGRDLTDELPTKNCFSKFQFPVNEAPKPDLPGSLLLCAVIHYLRESVVLIKESTLPLRERTLRLKESTLKFKESTESLKEPTLSLGESTLRLKGSTVRLHVLGLLPKPNNLFLNQ